MNTKISLSNLKTIVATAEDAERKGLKSLNFDLQGKIGDPPVSCEVVLKMENQLDTPEQHKSGEVMSFLHQHIKDYHCKDFATVGEVRGMLREVHDEHFEQHHEHTVAAETTIKAETCPATLTGMGVGVFGRKSVRIDYGPMGREVWEKRMAIFTDWILRNCTLVEAIEKP